MKFRVRRAPALLACLAMVGVGLAPTSAAADGGRRPLNGIKHIVVIYEENHSFDNLYGLWGDVDGQHLVGLPDADVINQILYEHELPYELPPPALLARHPQAPIAV